MAVVSSMKLDRLTMSGISASASLMPDAAGSENTGLVRLTISTWMRP